MPRVTPGIPNHAFLKQMEDIKESHKAQRAAITYVRKVLKTHFNNTVDENKSAYINNHPDAANVFDSVPDDVFSLTGEESIIATNITNYYGDVLSGKKMPTEAALTRYAKDFGLSLDERKQFIEAGRAYIEACQQQLENSGPAAPKKAKKPKPSTTRVASSVAVLDVNTLPGYLNSLLNQCVVNDLDANDLAKKFTRVGEKLTPKKSANAGNIFQALEKKPALKEGLEALGLNTHTVFRFFEPEPSGALDERSYPFLDAILTMLHATDGEKKLALKLFDNIVSPKRPGFHMSDDDYDDDYDDDFPARGEESDGPPKPAATLHAVKPAKAGVKVGQ